MGGELSEGWVLKLRITVSKELRREGEQPVPVAYSIFELSFHASVEVHHSASILQLCNRRMILVGKFRPRFDGGKQQLTGSTRSI